MNLFLSVREFVDAVKHRQEDMLSALCAGRAAYGIWEPLVHAFLCAAFDVPQPIREDGALRGVTVGVKDLIDVAGMPTTGGSKAYHFYPQDDAAVVRRLRQEGAFIVGKTNTQELAYGVVTPPTRNPWNLNVIPGGSSGGSAAAVATGMVQVALGTDTGGSVRIPASCCGVIGFKPSYGVISRHGVMALSYTLDHVGLLAMNVEDIQYVFNLVLQSPEPSDPAVVQKASRTRGHKTASKTLAVPTIYVRDHADCQVADRFFLLVEWLGGKGWNLQSIDFPPWSEWKRLQLNIRLPEAYHVHRDVLETERRFLLQDDLAQRLSAGKDIPAYQYVAALMERQSFIRQWTNILSNYDAVLMPTLPVSPPFIGETQDVMINGRSLPVWDAMVMMTAPWNVLGFPALSLPWYRDTNDVPMGVQLIGNLYEDEELLKTASSLQQELGVYAQRPPMPTL